MKRLFFATVTLATICGGRLSASSVIDCSGTAGAINSCVASKLPNFQTQLDWAILGQPFNGSISNSPWSGSQGGIDIQVTPVGSPTLGGSEGLRLAYNVGTAFYLGQWTLTSAIPSAGYTHPGHFNATSNPGDTIAGLQADPSIRLLGLSLSGGSTTEGMLLDFNDPFVNLGFYGAAKHDTNFSLTIQIFSGAGGTGTLLSNDTFTYNGPGGLCATMESAPSGPPTGCNDAPFIYASGFNTGKSVLITSSDQTGFYITSPYVGQAAEAVPEPGPMVLCGCGIALLALGSRKLRRQA